jgi:hydroxyacylglutathione hydrolase
MANFTYIIADERKGEAAIIDPSWDIDKILDVLKKNKWKAKYVINTHSHFDHILGNEQVAEITGANIIQHESSQVSKHISVSEGDIVNVGDIPIRILHTPGHSVDSMCLIVDGHLVFTGDTLFVGNCGRVDLPGSNAKEMYTSLLEKVAKLDESLTVFPGHDYGPSPTSKIGKEKMTNYVLRPRSMEEFLQFMAADE